MARYDSHVDGLRKYIRGARVIAPIALACITDDASRGLSKLSNGIINRSVHRGCRYSCYAKPGEDNRQFDVHYAFTTAVVQPVVKHVET